MWQVDLVNQPTLALDSNPQHVFECPVCLDKRPIPKILKNCGHSICEECEKQLVRMGAARTISCPICRKPTKLDFNEKLPTNWLALEST
ncbi:hypothetical protein L596_029130 [Steinernema carpocapsae]|uniref:RING-type domain-containing protein n=1 Tax=Steinernema carpocapsae TaxID=34508 RepID=A0A4V6XVL5_STECR|nr:hypothetical protein L596_029130 [Steinernema carpocapsae]